MTTKNQTNKHFIRFMPKSAAESKPYVCYLLHASEATKGPRTYVGITNNLTRRLRQHNREISGGSKYTGAICEGQWQCVGYFEGFRTKQEALQFEWAWHHSKTSGKTPLDRRINEVNKVLAKERWTSKAPLASEVALTFRILCPEYEFVGQQLCSLVTIVSNFVGQTLEESAVEQAEPMETIILD